MLHFMITLDTAQKRRVYAILSVYVCVIGRGGRGFYDVQKWVWVHSDEIFSQIRRFAQARLVTLNIRSLHCSNRVAMVIILF